jgi:hypothetical protein
MFLHAVGSTGHIVRSGMSGARNVSALFFMLGWPGAEKNASGHIMSNGNCYTRHQRVIKGDEVQHNVSEASAHEGGSQFHYFSRLASVSWLVSSSAIMATPA